MKRDEFALWAAALQTYYPREKLLPNKQALELWFRQLEDIPYKVAETALNTWVATEKWPPSIAEVREKAAQIVTGMQGDWGEGWKQVIDAVHRYGSYSPKSALESLDEITRECVERMGFSEICRTENMSVERANFRMLYEQIASRKMKEAQTPERIRKLIGTLRQERLISE